MPYLPQCLCLVFGVLLLLGGGGYAVEIWECVPIPLSLRAADAVRRHVCAGPDAAGAAAGAAADETHPPKRARLSSWRRRKQHQHLPVAVAHPRHLFLA